MNKFIFLAALFFPSCANFDEGNCYTIIPILDGAEVIQDVSLMLSSYDDVYPYIEQQKIYSDSYCDVAAAKAELSSIGYSLDVFLFDGFQKISEAEYRESPSSYGLIDLGEILPEE